jgi:hypothetical protein
VPQSSGSYMKLKQGANKFRILSAPILGYEYWTEDRKPVRARQLWNVIPVNADISKGWNPKHFWAFVVWNFDDKAIQILELTQATIQRALTELIHNEDWGDPRGYSITINRKGESLDTEYSVVPSPAKPTPQEIMTCTRRRRSTLRRSMTAGTRLMRRSAIRASTVRASLRIQKRPRRRTLTRTTYPSNALRQTVLVGRGSWNTIVASWFGIVLDTIAINP